VNCLFFAPLLRFSRLHSKPVVFLVVFYAFGDFIFAPPLFFLPFHGRSRELFIFLRPFYVFTLAQQASCVFGGDFVVFSGFDFLRPFYVFHACTASQLCFFSSGFGVVFLSVLGLFLRPVFRPFHGSP
jgi:hypothetical protein